MSNFNLAANVDRLIASQAGQGANTRQAFADKAKAEEKRKRKEARQAKRQRKAEGVMGAIGSFAESVAAGLQAEGERRAKLGLSGSGFAAAFGAGASEIIDFGKLQKAKRKSAMIQKLGFAPADAEADAALIETLDALTTALSKQNQSVAPRPMPTDDDDDPVTGTGPEDRTEPVSDPSQDPLAMPEQPPQGEPTEAERREALERAKAMLGGGEETPKTEESHPVARDLSLDDPRDPLGLLDNPIELPDIEEPGVFDLNSIPGLQRNFSMENN